MENIVRTLIGALVLVSCVGVSAGKVTPGQLKEQFVRAQTPEERRDLCIRAIDEGVISHDATTRVVDEIFQTHPLDEPRLLGTEPLEKSWKDVWHGHDAHDLSLRVVTLAGEQSAAEHGRTALRYFVAVGGSGTPSRGDSSVPGTVSDAIEGYFLCNCAYARYVGPSRKTSVPEWKRMPAASSTAQIATGGAPSPEATRQADELKSLYWAANTQYERRSVLLRALDEGLVREGENIKIVDQIFGTNCSSRTGPNVCLVEFLGLHQISGERRAAEYAKSWYFRARYDEGGRIDCFWLTNIHFKGSPM